MRDTEKALHWIVDLLRARKIKFKISDGFACRVHGVNRELADIDFELEERDIYGLFEAVKPYVIFGPARFKDENWDIELMTLNYLGQEIDLASNKAKIFNSTIKEWENIYSNLDEFTLFDVFGLTLSIDSKESLLDFKQKLGREVDLEDIRQLNGLPSCSLTL